MQTVLALFLWWMLFGAERSLTGSIPAATHPFHVSVTEINQNATARTLEVQCKLFTDDFEATLKEVFKQKADLVDPALHEKMDSLVSRYVRSRLQLRVNEKAAVLQYLGFEHDREATYVYLEIENTAASIRSLEGSASLLYESFSDQVNIFHVTTTRGKKSTKLDYPATAFRLDFE
ncbi:MAG: DUF6702 family protein [Sphingomonadales bacterium]